MGNPQNLQVPDDQLHLPRADRQFPYRAANPAEADEIRLEADAILKAVEGIVVRFSYEIAPAGFTKEDLQDLQQEVRLHLWRNALPRYDAWRTPRVKVSTFLYRSGWRATLDHARRMKRRRRLPVDSLGDHDPHARDTLQDRLIETLAHQILTDPSILRKSRHALALIHQPVDQSDAEAAAGAGLSTSAYQDARHRLRQKCIRLLHAA